MVVVLPRVVVADSRCYFDPSLDHRATTAQTLHCSQMWLKSLLYRQNLLEVASQSRNWEQILADLQDWNVVISMKVGLFKDLVISYSKEDDGEALMTT